MPQLDHTSEIACPPEQLFEFLNDPRNRAVLSPPAIRYELLEGPKTFAEGSRFSFEVRAYGQRQKFTHEITDWAAAVGYTETQIAGPFGAMQNVRRIEPAGDGSRLVERVAFEPPGGMLGFVLTEARLRGMLTEGFAHAHGVMQRKLGGSGEVTA